MNFTQFIAEHWLDMLTTILGIAYIILEYRASIWLWVVGFFMQSLGIILYYQKGLYADCGMEFYYLAMTIYGFIAWKYTKGPKKKPYSNSDQDIKEGELSQGASDSRVSKSQPEETYAIRTSKAEKPITHFKKSLVLPWIIITLTIWGALYYFLITFTDSKVPIADSFTTALSFVGIWALARKYLEQWFIWIVVDIVTCVLYYYKDIPFKASLYGLYIVIAFMGYFKWKRMMKVQKTAMNQQNA